MNNPVTCPEACTNTLSAVDSSVCSPQFRKGQVQRVFLTDLNQYANFDEFAEPVTGTEVNDPEAWSARMDQTAVANGAIITLHVIGEKPRPEDEKAEFSLGRERVTGRKHTVNFTCDETSDLIHDFFRRVSECGWTGGVWYETSAPDLFSSTDGHHIPITGSIAAGMVIPRERSGLRVWEGEITWEELGTETAMESPVPATPETGS